MDDDFDFMGGSSDNAAPQQTSGNEGEFLGGDDDFSQYQNQQPQEEVQQDEDDFLGESHHQEQHEEQQQHQEEQQQFYEEDTFDAPAPAPAPAFSAAPAPAPAPAASFEENPFTKWQKQHQIHLQQKSAASDEKSAAARKTASEWIENFYKERSVKFENVQRLNRDNEAETISARDNALATGPAWERVCGLVDLQAKTDGRDTARMRQVLVQIKNHPPAHMQAA